jgi:hypothetical protein
MNTNLIKLELEGQIVGYRQLGKDGRFHMVLVVQGLIHPTMPWNCEYPCTSVHMHIDGGNNQKNTYP